MAEGVMTRAEASKRRIILAAESLIARQGIGGVSAREVAKAAGLRNNVSVQYHFGSMERLFEAIPRFRMVQLEIVRCALLAEAETAGRLNNIRTLLEIICLPHVTLTDEEGRHPYAAFMVQYMPRYQPTGFSWYMNSHDPYLPALNRLLALFRDLLPDLPREVLHRRLTSATLHFLNVLIAHDIEEGLASHEASAAIMLQDCLSQMTAAISVPYVPEISADLEWIFSGAERLVAA